MGLEPRNEHPMLAVSEDRLILDEFTHRTANEIAAAIAAVRIARRMKKDAARDGLLDDAIGRLEAFGEVHRLLSVREQGVVPAGNRLRSLCCALASSRPQVEGVLTLDVPDVDLDATTTRCLMMVGSELVANGFRHALTSGGSRLLVRLAMYRSYAVMTVADDGPGMKARPASSGTGLGRGIVEELAARSGGWIVTRSSTRGTRIRVVLPIAPASARRMQRS